MLGDYLYNIFYYSHYERSIILCIYFVSIFSKKNARTHSSNT